MNNKNKLYTEISDELKKFLLEQENKFNKDETLTIDLHCHDHNSDEPDELLGRILGIPETWLPTNNLINTLNKHGCNAYTITNHNNSRSCYELLDKGYDILVGAEFSCMVPEFSTGIHVLAYGFNPAQEKLMLKYRNDITKFLTYTSEQNIPTACAHPLYHYKNNGVPPLEFFDSLLLYFERFEVLNGQRDTWQNMLVKNWLDNATPEKIDKIAKKTGIKPDTFCKDSYRKAYIGGSDSHMGIFSGLTGTRLYIPNLKNRLKTASKAELALEALNNCTTAPFGGHNDSEKMTITFIDYLCQIAMNMEDPGLLRILMHKGDSKDKMLAIFLSNIFSEIQRHKTTMSFMRVFHDSFTGKGPSVQERIFVKKAYKPVVTEVTKMASVQINNPEISAQQFKKSLQDIFNHLNKLGATRLHSKLSRLEREKKISNIEITDILEKLEVPSRLRFLLDGKKYNGEWKMSSLNFNKFFDGLSFPILGSAVILAANYASARVMYNTRPLLNKFSENLGVLQQPKRALWLTDTFDDNNGVAMVLQSVLKEICDRNLPIDIMVTSKILKSQDHLIVIPPITEFSIPMYKSQALRVPNFLMMHHLFLENEYDRIICSTEGFMGLAAIYLKKAYSVPAYFYMHTDWLLFAKKVMKLDAHNRSRLKRLLRTFYSQFDKLFTLNNDHANWLTSSSMGFTKDRVALTAHWTESFFKPTKSSKEEMYGVTGDDQVLLFAGRVSEEKGVMELPDIYNAAKQILPKLKLAIIGKGPAEEKLKAAIPDAIFCGWIDHAQLPDYYSSADLLILPSQFDTFGCVVLEALSCGLPVVSYNTKGPKDIIEHNKCGFLASNKNQMTNYVISYLLDKKLHMEFRKSAVRRGNEYSADNILKNFLNDIDL